MKFSSTLAIRQSRKYLFGLSPWLLIGVSFVLGLAVLVLAIRNSERERTHTIQSYFERAEALIWALEAGARTEKGLGVQGDLLQALIEETARQPGIAYMSIVAPSGKIIAHSDVSNVGSTVPDGSLPGDLVTRIAEYKDGRDGRGKIFEVYRGFSPLSQEHEPQGAHAKKQGENHREHLGSHMGVEAASQPESLEKGIASSFIFVGFDKNPFDDALAADLMNNLLAACLVAGLGFGGFISMFWAHSHKVSCRKLKDTQALASEVLRSLPLGLVTSDPEDNLSMINATALTMFKTSREVVQDQPVKSLSGLDWDSITSALARDKKFLERETVLMPIGGKRIPVSVSASEIRDDGGLFLGYLYILRDITELKRLQGEAQKNTRLTTLGTLAAGVAHEIRNPLSSIKGLATYIARKMLEGGPEKEAADTMVLEVNRLNGVVAELLEFARPTTIKFSETDIDAVITRALRLAEVDIKSAKITVEYSVLKGFPLVFASSERLTQALLNLFLNALQAMQPGGKLGVSVKPLSKEEYAIEVSDTGHGIAPDVLESIFTPYFTTKPSGTGLGLAIVQQIIEGHGGSISVTSEPGQGTSFTVCIPLRPQEASWQKKS